MSGYFSIGDIPAPPAEPEIVVEADEPPRPIVVQARILDRGYRRYDGPRLGRSAALRSITRHTVQRCLGLRRPFRAKVFPLATVLIAYVPVTVFVGLAVFGNRARRAGAGDLVTQYLPTYAENHLFITLAVFVFAAFVAPEVLCPDRRNGMLANYLASSVSRVGYLWAKSVAIVSMLSIVTIGPSLILLIGLSVLGFGPASPREWFDTLGSILWSGATIAVLYTLVSLALSALAARKATASAGFVALMIGLPAALRFLIVDAGFTTRLQLADLATLPSDATFRIFGEAPPFVFRGVPLPEWQVWAAYGAWCGLAVLVTLVSYRRRRVVR